MSRVFKVPFATQGDTEEIPVETQGDGSVSFTQGFGFDYEREYDDPASKDIPRDVLNGILHDITQAVGEIQLAGISTWNTAATPYPINAFVRHAGQVWVARVGDNTVEPVQGVSWETLPNYILRTISARSLTAGTGLTGGGDLSANRTFALNAATIASLQLADSAIQSGDLAPVALSGRYNDLIGRPTLGTAASRNVGENAGNVMEVGAFGLGENNKLTNDIGVDSLDHLDVTGFYYRSGNTEGKPLGTNNGYIIHQKYNPEYSTQIYINSGGNESLHFRRKVADIWGEWRELYHSGNQLALGVTAATGRSALGLGASATNNTTALRTSAATNLVLQAAAMNNHRTSGDHDERYARKGLNLSDLPNAGTARSNLGLGNAATRTVGENSGNLMEVGAFGLGTLAARRIDDDLNNTYPSGLYYSFSAANSPNNGYIIQQVFSGSYSFQIYASASSPGLKTRVKNNGTWGAWTDVYDENNLNPVETSRTIATGSGLTGGGNLSANRTLSVDGSVVRTNQFSSSLSTDGHGWERNSVSGVIKQWGSSDAMPADGNATLTFPIVFPTTAMQVFVSIWNSDLGDDEVFARVIGWDRTTVTVKADVCSPTSSVSGSQRFISFLAIGY